mmetsp:Transcript_3473/g.4723  ORF Transcript_3473/g.4723 Transcript_3473/m.4723 type:complete len:443 (-) Transcript_3473:470-1798(-)
MSVAVYPLSKQTKMDKNVKDDSNSNETRNVPIISEREITLGRRLGEGGFCCVYDLVKFDLSIASSSSRWVERGSFDNGNSVSTDITAEVNSLADTDEKAGEGKEAISTTLVSANSSLSMRKIIERCRRKLAEGVLKGKYAIKRPKSTLPNELEKYKAVVDIQLEGNILTRLSHRNIIAIRGISEGINEQLPGWRTFYRDRKEGLRESLDSNHYFIVMDRLVCTLSHKLSKWRKMNIGQKSSRSRGACTIFTRLFRCSNDTHNDMIRDRRRAFDRVRINVALSIALAIQYLHQKDIVYRDLKPDNVGFNERGTLKLFDFGLAKQLHPGLKINDLYSLTGNTGSLRYMAPEVSRKLPYDHRVDSYSFGLLFWQLCKLSVPFENFTMEMHSELVVHKGYRPELDSMWPIAWRDLIRSCWHSNIYERPSFDEIVNILRMEAAILTT